MWFKPKGRQALPCPTHDEHGHFHEGQGVSRRRFLVGAAVGVAGFVVSRFLPPLPAVSQFLETHGNVSAAPSGCSDCGCPVFASTGCASVSCIGPPRPNCTNEVKWRSYGTYYIHNTHPLCVCGPYVCEIIIESDGCWSCCD